jgi:hypothetical protein
MLDVISANLLRASRLGPESAQNIMLIFIDRSSSREV